jgi:hypothetical protein
MNEARDLGPAARMMGHGRGKRLTAALAVFVSFSSLAEAPAHMRGSFRG